MANEKVSLVCDTHQAQERFFCNILGESIHSLPLSSVVGGLGARCFLHENVPHSSPTMTPFIYAFG
jgi:hypothetical protein